MASKQLIDALVAAVRASPIHSSTRIYVQAESGGMWKAVFIDPQEERISRISNMLESLEHLFGGSEHCYTEFHSSIDFACLEVS